MGCTIHSIVGNHTAYYKNTNEVNSIDLLLAEYDNIKTYSEATEIEIDGLNILLLPWINNENEKHTLNMIKKLNVLWQWVTLSVRDLEFIVGM